MYNETLAYSLVPLPVRPIDAEWLSRYKLPVCGGRGYVCEYVAINETTFFPRYLESSSCPVHWGSEKQKCLKPQLHQDGGKAENPYGEREAQQEHHAAGQRQVDGKPVVAMEMSNVSDLLLS